MYECKFCKKSFSNESTLVAHLCEPKRRWNNRKDTNVQLALRCYQHFFRISSTTMKNERNYEAPTKLKKQPCGANGESEGRPRKTTTPGVSR